MFLNRRVRRKDGKEHVYDSLCESMRVYDGRTVQRQVLHLSGARGLEPRECGSSSAGLRAGKT